MLAFFPSPAPSAPDLRASFRHPPESARPWVYWYFMDGHITREGMKNDLEAMHKAGIGGAIFLTVDIGIPRGPVQFMSPEWQSLVRGMLQEAAKDHIQIALGTGPGWCGAGGPWITPDEAMQHLVSSETPVTGPMAFHGKLPQPAPRTPFFGLGPMTPELEKEWREFYRDEVVLAVPTPAKPASLDGLDEKSLVYRAPYSSQAGVKPYLYPETEEPDPGSVVPSKDVLDLTDKLSPDGTLNWQAPAGKWTVIRFGRTLTGQTTRPAPPLGLGFESDKFERLGIDDHIAKFLKPIVGPGATFLHFDSWEMGSQNWSPHFRELFKSHRGYDPLPFLPVMAGQIVDSVSSSERFLWDLRQTSQELIKENQLGALHGYGAQHGIELSIEPYDMSPSADLSMGAAADAPQGEFWSTGFGFHTEYSIIEAASIGHTNGKPIVGAESFTATDGDGWLQYPGSMKAQTDWALATGVNRFIIHRYQHQPYENEFPGMTMGPYGVHWERTETWWNMVPAYHAYLSRCQELLREGLPVADILYLNPEGAPVVFQPAPGSMVGNLPDHRAYNFDGCAPETLIERASVLDGQIVFPDRTSYRLLVLPRVRSMTPRLARKIEELVRAGATVLGPAPDHSPSLSGRVKSDEEVRRVAMALWSGPVHRVGKGCVIDDPYPPFEPVSIDSAKWIWTNEGNPAVAAPVGERTFTKSFEVSDLKAVSSAKTAFTADNRFRLFVNGELVSSGTDFHQIETADVRSVLKAGVNTLRVEAINDGDAPNPAGLIGTLEVVQNDGQRVVVSTDSSWSASLGDRAVAEGPWNMGPWGVSSSSAGFAPMYPDYSVAVKILRERLHVPPDLDSGDALRYAHRITNAGDLYFIANRSDRPVSTVARFRTSLGTPEWWDPMTGKIRPLTSFTWSEQVTSIPLRLNGLQSGFVVFAGPALSPTNEPNFPSYSPIKTLAGGWSVSFNPRFGGPALVRFAGLSDWSQSSDDRIRYYSGEAVYRRRFDLGSSGLSSYLLDLGQVKDIASVRINDADLGVVWCTPFQVEIPAGLLKPRGNQIEVTVANLWVNRLIGDSKVPESQRVTKTTWSPYGPDSKLRPSGLLGPVRIMAR